MSETDAANNSSSVAAIRVVKEEPKSELEDETEEKEDNLSISKKREISAEHKAVLNRLKHRCSGCDRIFQSNEALHSHYCEVDLSAFDPEKNFKPLFKCRTCGRRFSTRKRLGKHRSKADCADKSSDEDIAEGSAKKTAPTNLSAGNFGDLQRSIGTEAVDKGWERYLSWRNVGRSKQREIYFENNVIFKVQINVILAKKDF